MTTFNTIEEALEDLRQGKIILVVDSPDRENEGDFICAGEFATLENINFMATHAKGLICMPMAEDYVEKLRIPQMVTHNTDNHETAFTVSIDHISTTTGISAKERSITALACVDDEAKAAGGLHIVGTERHESRRIDNQLRGRAGRQGDPGQSQFFISLEDDLMRLFGSERLMGMFEALGVPDGEQIHHKMLSNAIAKAQEKIELNNYGIRENLLKYDEVNNDQRDVIYTEREKVLEGDNMRPLIVRFITDTVDNYVAECIGEGQTPKEWDLSGLNDTLMSIIPLKKLRLTEEEYENMTGDELSQRLKEEAIRLYEQKEAEFPNPEQMREAERVILLKVMDQKWMSHIDDMDILRDGIGLQAYGQKDPLVEYKIAGYEMFQNMMRSIQEETIRVLYQIKLEQKVEREQVAKPLATNRDESAVRSPKQREGRKIYPNDPCPCGSGKKYKQCHGANLYQKN